MRCIRGWGRIVAAFAAVTVLAFAGIVISDLALRQPSLDDVFLAITGSATSGEHDA